MQEPGLVTTRKIGDLEVMALTDASGPFLPWQEAFPGATAAHWSRARSVDPGAFGDGGIWRLQVRCFAIRRPGGRAVLVDTGIGPEGSPAAGWAPVPGRLPAALEAAGLDAADVDTVVLTHLHEDHVGWTVTAAGTPRFPNAGYVVQRVEVTAMEACEATAVLDHAVRPLRSSGRLREVDGRVRLSGAGRDRLPGEITAVPTPGHTPGHQSVLVESHDARLMVTGDVLVHAVQLVDPAVDYVYEDDRELARRTRAAMLADAARGDTWLATMHLGEPFLPARMIMVSG